MRATEKFAVLGRDAVDGLANDPRPTATGRCRDAATGKYHHVRLFVMTLAYSRKAVRLLTANSSATCGSTGSSARPDKLAAKVVAAMILRAGGSGVVTRVAFWG